MVTVNLIMVIQYVQLYMYLSDSDNGSGYCNNSDRNHSGYVLNMIMVVVIIVKVLTMVCS